MKNIFFITSSIVILIIATYIYTSDNKYKQPFVNVVEKEDLHLYKIPPSGENINLGVSFGGGGIRGFAHFGAIKALNESGIDFQISTGASAGSIASILYSSGLSISEMENFIEDVLNFEILSLSLDKRGIINGIALTEVINSYVKNKKIEDLEKKVGIAVTDYTNSKLKYIVSGDSGFSSRVSSSVPGSFSPVMIDKKMYVDGGVLSVLPINLAKGLGADYVLGIDIYCNPNNRIAPTNSIAIIFGMAAIQSCKISKDEFKNADNLISIEFNPNNYSSIREIANAAILAGYEQTKNKIPEIKAKIEMMSNSY